LSADGCARNGKLIHNFVPVWQEHIGTIGDNEEVHDDSTMPFVVDEGAIKNIVHITAKNIRWPIKAEQWHYFAYDTQLEIYDPVEFMFGKALAAQPENMQVFLLVGSLNEDLSKVQGARLIELKVKTVNPDDADAVGFNILNHLAKVDRRFMGDDFSGGTIARGNTTLTPELTNQNEWQVLQTSLVPAPVLEYGTGAVTNPYDGEVQDYIIGCYSDAFAVSYQSNPYQDNPETIYGLLSLFKIEHLKANIKALSEAIGTNIEPDQLLGYYITYDFRSDYTVPFINQESIDKYGPQLAPDVNFDVDDIDTINFYGEKKIQQLSEERENGKFTYDHWHEGQELFDEWPRPGQLVDVKLGPYGLKEDVQIRTVRRHWKAGYCEITIESMFSPTYGLIENLVKRIETVASNKNSKTASAIASILKISDHIILSDSVRIYTVDKNRMRFRGQRLWELEFV
jgi:hypothetical protein